MNDLETALQEFEKEVTNASWPFYVWKHINNFASNDGAVLKALNENALSWRVINHSLQCTFFIALGRLFDDDRKSFTAENFLKQCIANIDQFSSEPLKARKVASMNGDEPSWLNDCVRNAHLPTEKDLEPLLSHILEQKESYQSDYKQIRNKVMAHKDWDTIGHANELFSKTNIDQLQHMFVVLYQVEKVIRDLLYNGKLNKIEHYEFNEEERIQKDVETLLARLKT